VRALPGKVDARLGPKQRGVLIAGRTVSLVLGSGGARGLAHIGVIEWLEEHGYEIRVIAGASMGALIGGIHAAGKLEAYTQWVRALTKRDVLHLLHLNFNRAGLSSGDRLMETLRGLLGDTEIENLPIAFTAVATDLDTQKEVWIREGSLFDAIRASIAIPTVFTPVRYRGHLLVDGGLLNPVPIAPTMDDVTDLTIAVDLRGRRDVVETRPEPAGRGEASAAHRTAIRQFIETLQEKLRAGDGGREEAEENLTVIDLVLRSFETMQRTITRFKMAAYSPDHIVEIPANACMTFEFDRAEEMIALGYERTGMELGRL